MNVLQIKQELLRRPSLIDGQAAALRIIGQRERCTPEKAKERLGELAAAGVINDLFRAVMPREYKARTGTSRIQNASAFWKLLAFPVQSEYVLESIRDGAFFSGSHIPFYSLNPHICLNCQSFQSFSACYQLALLLNRPMESVWGDPLEEADYEGAGEKEFWGYMVRTYRVPESLRPTGLISRAILARVFSLQRSPLKHLPLAISVTEYNTGSMFLDYQDENGAEELDLPWDKPNVDFLRRDYQLAEEVMKKVNGLKRWLTSHTAARVAHACFLYQKALKLTNEEKRKHKSRIRVGVAGQALVGIL